MAFDALMPWWALVLLTAGAAGLAVRAYTKPVVSLDRQQRAVLVALRLSVLLLLLFILQRPVWLEPSTERRDAVVPILVDVSRSMRLDDVDGRRRIDEAVALVEQELLPLVGDAFDVDVLSFGEALGPLDLAAAHAMLDGAISAARCGASESGTAGSRSPGSSSCRMVVTRAGIKTHRGTPARHPCLRSVSAGRRSGATARSSR